MARCWLFHVQVECILDRGVDLAGEISFSFDSLSPPAVDLFFVGLFAGLVGRVNEAVEVGTVDFRLLEKELVFLVDSRIWVVVADMGVGVSSAIFANRLLRRRSRPLKDSKITAGLESVFFSSSTVASSTSNACSFFAMKLSEMTASTHSSVSSPRLLPLFSMACLMRWHKINNFLFWGGSVTPSESK